MITTFHEPDSWRLLAISSSATCLYWSSTLATVHIFTELSAEGCTWEYYALDTAGWLSACIVMWRVLHGPRAVQWSLLTCIVISSLPTIVRSTLGHKPTSESSAQRRTMYAQHKVYATNTEPIHSQMLTPASEPRMIIVLIEASHASLEHSDQS